MIVINRKFLQLENTFFLNKQKEPNYPLQDFRNKKLLSVIYKLPVTSLLSCKFLSGIQNVDIFALFLLQQYITLSDLEKRKYINVIKINYKILRETKWS